MASAHEFGLRVAILRDRRHLSQEALGLAIGFSPSSAQSSISKLELGKQTINTHQLMRLAAVLGVSIADLFTPVAVADPLPAPFPVLTAEVLDLARAGANAPPAVVVAATHLIRELSTTLPRLSSCPVP